MEVLSVRVDNLSREEILEKIEYFLSKERLHQIATINPEFILETQKDAEFKNILNNCDLNVADGFGLNFAFWKKGEKLKYRMPGADLMGEILKMAEKNNQKIFLVANSRGLSTWEETAKAIKKKYSGLEISGTDIDIKSPNYPAVAGPHQGGGKLLITNYQNYEVIFANLGAPYQEKFLNSLKSAGNSKIRLLMGVGGSFDYLTGKTRRAPVFMRKLGLEWLWRLLNQPGRIRRVVNAVIIFPIKIIFNKK